MNRLTTGAILAIIFNLNSLVVLVFILSAGNVSAEESKVHSTSLVLTYYKLIDTCKLQEVGSAKKIEYFEFTGNKDKENKHCVIQINKADFDLNFYSCRRSSFDKENNINGACASGIRDDTYVFLAGTPSNKESVSTQLCTFICQAKNSGNKSR